MISILLTLLVSITGGDSTKPPLVEIKVYPERISLNHSEDVQSIVVQARYADGTTEDVTSQALAELQASNVARIHRRLVHPLLDGTDELRVTYEGAEALVPIRVDGVKASPPVSFRRDVLPVLTKTGCNAGGCHGSSRGQDGFRLSLFGYDPTGDYFRLTREMMTRRIDLASPHESLLLEKATGAVPHSGGTRFTEETPAYQTILDWIQAGAPEDPADIALPSSIAIMPQEAVLLGEGADQQFLIEATYSDGTTRDVTSLAVFQSSNETSSAVDSQGRVVAHAPGEAFITARFSEFNVGSPVIVLAKGGEWREEDSPPAHNDIDRAIDAKLKRLRVSASPLCSDEEFVRRAYLDVVGLLPTREQYGRFVADSSEDKRDRLISELLNRPEFAEIWVMKWAELLQVRTDRRNRLSYKATLRYYDWLKEKIQGNHPLDQTVREILSSTGSTFRFPQNNYYQVETDPLKIAENVAQVFLGMRIQCAQCHNHPFDRWTMDDYYGFASFFTQVGRKNGEDPRERIIFNRGRGEVNHPVTEKPIPPRFLGGEVPDVERKDRRRVVAEWMTSPENPYFARHIVNLVWAHLIGRGIVEPVDDVRVSNPPANDALLDLLAQRFVESKYDFKALVRLICQSRTYQLSTEVTDANANDRRNFSRAPIRRIRAEILLDAISQVTETPNKFRGLPLGARAVQIADGNTSNYFLTTFGRASRETVCSCEVKMEPNLSQALHLLNGDSTTNRIRRGKVIDRLLDQSLSLEEVIKELYGRCLTREPTEVELTRLCEKLEEGNRVAGLQDLFWALLNSKEFIFQH